jgi:hypothetical protein
MSVETDNVIHIQNGRLGHEGNSTQADVSRILKKASAENPKQGLVVHFHGGLVSAKKGLGIANRLHPVYKQAEAYPLFFVWESGFKEAVFNNFGDIWENNLKKIMTEKFFQELVKKTSEWALKKSPVDVGARGNGQNLNEIKFRHDFDKWFATGVGTPPVPMADSLAAAPGTARSAVPNESSMVQEIEAGLQGDPDFQAEVQAVYNGLMIEDEDVSRSMGPDTKLAARNSLISPDAAKDLFDTTLKNPDNTRGVFSWFKVAAFVGKLVIRVIKRHVDGRGHGFYCTVVEEVLRGAYGDKVGKVFWGNMKKDTQDAFEDGADRGGTAFLRGLQALQDENKGFPRITLVGHSAGSIMVCNLLKAAAKELPGIKFDVVFLAPAVTHSRFAETLAADARSHMIGSFRCFAMDDKVESDDALIPVFYPRSLLYFVSGLLEDTIDEPLVGMERYLVHPGVFANGSFPAIGICKEYLKDRLAWSVSKPGTKEGFLTGSLAHGDFDNDPTTLESLAAIVKKGF